jgi:hypothetical protein
MCISSAARIQSISRGMYDSSFVGRWVAGAEEVVQRTLDSDVGTWANDFGVQTGIESARCERFI